VVPAGEQWPDGTLRPSIEDWLGAGAILSHLPGASSPEADLAREAFLRQSGNITALLVGSASGRELIDQGWSDDVAVASQVGVSESAPVLLAGGYQSLPDDVGVAAI
jgi:2-phosphosulfolactate phosphatase